MIAYQLKMQVYEIQDSKRVSKPPRIPWDKDAPHPNNVSSKNKMTHSNYQPQTHVLLLMLR